jgi:hypothetical protein
MTASPARRQHGAALLALLAMIMVGGAWWLLSVIQPVNRLALERAKNAPVLMQAKQALLGWSATEAILKSELNPGRLPCPEAPGYIGTANEGIMASNCTLPAIGRLPWRSLGIDQPRDATGEPLWYIVSAGWAFNGTHPIGINSNSLGNLTVDGQANAAVALIIAPGRPMVVAPNANQAAAGCAARTQVRSPTAPNYLDYLECQNAAGATLRTAVVDNAINNVLNDQMLIVTAEDVLTVVEPVVTARILRDVAPQLQGTYANASWGGTAAEPFFPFAVSYPAAPTALDAATSDFKGVVGASQGLLPMTAATCNTLTAGRCDANFVAWNTATVTATQTGGSATTFTANCASSSATQVTCTIDFSVLLCILCVVDAGVRVQANANNVGRALKTLNAGAATGLTTFTAPLQADGSAQGTYIGTLYGGTTLFGISGLCGSFIAVLCSGSATVTVPIGVFQDHALVNPTGPGTPDDWYWFVANKWHHVTYYAISPANAPGGPRNCTATSSCLNVTYEVGTSLTDKRAILALAGRSLNGTSGSSRVITDFLDTAVNVDFNSTFEQKRFGRAFNDRFVSVAP